MSFIFNSANNNIIAGSLDLFNGTFNLYVVKNIPVSTSNTVSNLSLFSNISPIELTNNFTTNSWSFLSTVIPLYTYNTQPVGFVISKQLSTNPSASDPIIYFSEFTNSLGQIIIYSTGFYRIIVNFSTTGVISFSNTNEYFSGTFINSEATPKGVIYLLGSNNNTAPFINPTPLKLNTYFRNSAGTTSAFGSLAFTNRNNATSSLSKWVMVDCLNKKIKVKTAGVFLGTSSAGTLTLFGSNTLSAFDLANLTDATKWTSLGSIVAPTASSWNFINCTDLNYYQYLKYEMVSGADIQINQIEFYSSSILSSSLNLT